MTNQKTIEKEITLSGKGLFSGQDVEITFKPAPEDTGIVFVRTDQPEPVRIKADIKNIAERGRRSALKKGAVSVETTEHCLAAASSLGITNLIIELNAPELPGFDGSSIGFHRAFKKAKILQQQEAIEPIIIDRPITIQQGDATIHALPGSDEFLQVTYDLDYTKHTGIGRQIYSTEITESIFERDIAKARTFLLEAEALQFQSRGIGKHLSPRDILVINSDGPIKNEYRYKDECVRHKVADLIGDLALVGQPICGRVICYKSGHDMNHKLAAKLKSLSKRQMQIKQYGTDALLDIRRIQKILPHRYPFLLVDRVLDIDSGKKITGLKNVTFNELFFQGHFPSTPIMPGVLILEALAQVSGLLFAQTLENTGKLAVLVSMNNVKMRKPVVPGDQLMLISEMIKAKSRTGHCKCVAKVGDKVSVEAEIKFMLVDDEKI